MRDKFFLKVSLDEISFNPACDIIIIFLIFFFTKTTCDNLFENACVFLFLAT